MEFVLRRSLGQEQATLPGLHLENKQKVTGTPTAERLLKTFSDVSLTIIKNAVGEEVLRRLTPLSGIQEDILQRLGLGASLYRQLEIQVVSLDSVDEGATKNRWSLADRADRESQEAPDSSTTPP